MIRSNCRLLLNESTYIMELVLYHKRTQVKSTSWCHESIVDKMTCSPIIYGFFYVDPLFDFVVDTYLLGNIRLIRTIVLSYEIYTHGTTLSRYSVNYPLIT